MCIKKYNRTLQQKSGELMSELSLFKNKKPQGKAWTRKQV